jgi:hypothetical protein
MVKITYHKFAIVTTLMLQRNNSTFIHVPAQVSTTFLFSKLELCTH